MSNIFNITKSSYFRVFSLITLLVLEFVFLYAIFVSSTVERIEQSERKEYELKQSFEVKFAKSVNLDKWQVQIEEIKTRYRDYLSILPNKISLNDVLSDIENNVSRNSVQLVNLHMISEVKQEFYGESHFKITLEGAFDDILFVLEDRFDYPALQISRVEDYSFTARGKNRVLFDGVIVFYRYYDDEVLMGDNL